jgi:drug/metabolite transporter (DMT)-like permease
MKKVFKEHWLFALFILSVLFTGFNAIGVHYVVAELDPFWGATLRFFPASLILFLVVFILRLPFPTGRALWGAVLFGVLNFGVSYAFIYFGLVKIQPGLAGVIMALVPLFTFFFAILHRQEKFRWRVLIGGLLAFAGIVFVFVEGLNSNIPLLYCFAVLLGAVCISEAGVVAKNYPKSHPITTSAIAMATGSLILFVLSILTGEKLVLPQKANTWFALTFLILIGSCLVFILFLYILKYWRASTLAYQFVLMPFVTITASAWITHETVNGMILIGAAFVLSGVFVGAFSRSEGKKIERLNEQPIEYIEKGVVQEPSIIQEPGC